MNVYTQLLNFKDALIRTADERSATLAPEALDEVRSTDALVLSAELERFRRRLAYWMARREELRSEQGDG